MRLKIPEWVAIVAGKTVRQRLIAVFMNPGISLLLGLLAAKERPGYDFVPTESNLTYNPPPRELRIVVFLAEGKDLTRHDLQRRLSLVQSLVNASLATVALAAYATHREPPSCAGCFVPAIQRIS